jgi:RimJ/RimL family protein N-acetyltransferase
VRDQPVLTGSLIRLRPLTADDASVMFESLSDPETMRLTGTHESFTLEQVRAFCERVPDEVDRVDYIIESLADPGVAQGEAVLNDIDRDNHIATFRIALYGPDRFSKGMGTEATRLIVEFGFEILNLHKIELEVYAFNTRAKRVYDKIGFVEEGVRRDALLWEGERVDAIMMGLLRTEFLQPD